MSSSFWEKLDTLIATSKLIIDRPKGGSHPKYPSVIYPLDYGFLEGTSGGDGDEIDVWRGSLSDNHLDAIICTVDPIKRDAEVKLLVGCSAEEKKIVCGFHGGSHAGVMFVDRNTDNPSP